MTWLRRQRFRRFRRTSLWLVPVACMAAALAVAPVIRWIDTQTQWTLLDFGPDGARNVLGGLASSLLTFIVFAFSTLTVSVQIASGQLTPRIIARVFEDRLTKIANVTCKVITEVYPESFWPDGIDRALPSLEPGRATKTIFNEGRSGVVLAIDPTGLAAIAERAGCTIAVVPMIGDFLATGDAVFLIHGGMLPAQLHATLCDYIDLGSERTLTQDPRRHSRRTGGCSPA